MGDSGGCQRLWPGCHATLWKRRVMRVRTSVHASCPGALCSPLPFVWSAGARMSLVEQLRALTAQISWSEVKSVFEYVLYLLAVIAVLGCLIRLGTIRKTIADFRESRGPIWDLRNTVNQLNELAPLIRTLADQVDLMDERVQAWGKQVTELQVEASSVRTDAEDSAQTEQDGDGLTPPIEIRPAEDVEDPNWLLLRDIWRRNTRRLEYVIDQIGDGRTKIAFDRLPRTNYERIINKLQGQKRISVGAANASRSLIEEFNRYRPRNRAVPDEVIGGLKTLDHQLDREIVPISTVVAAEEDDRPTTRSPSVRRSTPVARAPAINLSQTSPSAENNSGQPNV